MCKEEGGCVRRREGVCKEEGGCVRRREAQGFKTIGGDDIFEP